MRSYQLYIFDFDDTLLLTFQKVANLHYPLLAQRLGLKYFGEEEVRRNWGGRLETVFPKIFSGRWETSEMLEVLRAIHLEHPVEAAQGALRALDILKKHGKFLAIASSGDLEMINNGIRTGLNRLPGFFDYVYSTAANGTHKPNPEIVQSIRMHIAKQNKLHIAAQDVVYIGDSLADYESARSNGVDFYAVTTGVHTADDFLRAGLPTDRIFSSLVEVLTPEPDHGVVALIQNKQQEYLLIQEGRPHSPYYGAWSGPHGRCQPEDILEEESVAREVLEECGLHVKPVRRVFMRAADTKVKTVAFWECLPLQALSEARIADHVEVADLRWYSLEEIRSGKLFLYTGTHDYFFNHIMQTM